MAAESNRSRYARRAAAGLCADCWRKVSGGKARCKSCAKRAAESRHAPGACRDCKAPVEVSANHRTPRCASCREKNRVSYRTRVLSGQCVFCKEAATAGAFCLHHWFKNIGSSHHLTKSNGGIALLKLLWEEQNGRCSVTGEQLVPGVNASLDHITPVSKGGRTEKSNLRWVTLQVNHIKWDLTDDEFLGLCRLIVNRAEIRATVETSKKFQASRSN